MGLNVHGNYYYMVEGSPHVWLQLRSRSRPGCGLDLKSQPWLRSRSRPGHRLDLEPWQIRSSGSRSNLQPGLDLDLSHGCDSRSRSKPQL